MNKVEVITPWVEAIFGDDTTSNHPKIQDDYPYVQATGYGILSWEDTTGQPSENLSPDPNSYIVFATCDDATLADLEADASYYVLTSEVIVDEAI